MAKFAALLVLAAAAVLGLFPGQAAAAFLGHPPTPTHAASPEAAARVLDAVASTPPPAPAPASASPAVDAAAAAHQAAPPVEPVPTTTPPTSTPARPATDGQAAVLAPALQVAAGEPNPVPERLEVLGDQEIAGPAARGRPRPAAPPSAAATAIGDGGSLARTGPAATDDLLALAMGLVLVGSLLCRATTTKNTTARGRRRPPS
jgi:hypothetical protein